jgi:hypothetical protein
MPVIIRGEDAKANEVAGCVFSGVTILGMIRSSWIM